ncbi:MULTISPECIES: peroxiredoxin-like family protein [Nitrospirillum]|uniref:Peroxiredoxin n=1 Tax=Nitrospirillum amazonense TaxID=28077 RepID=A0A560GA47_9PROT|nr:peroxiredoxin-like family protein [Nitrospirillum amazonense]MEC4591234.1 peroxiredoxin-like family protein [Nitrospirillum amazonense]TWB30777.1 peroxiredoxin [Nitrospirillum amazonense]
MTQSAEPTLTQLFADLHAHRVATMDPAQLQINIDQRRELVETADRSAFVRPGDRLVGEVLQDVEGGTLHLGALLARGPVALVFFRFATCPACNIALPYYQRHLEPGLRALGIQLVAVSPQVPERLVDIKRRHDLTFIVASDRDNTLGRRLGIVFTANAASQASQLAKGTSLGEVTGTGTWDLPMPAVLLLDRDGVVRYADVTPDWLARTEPGPVLQAACTLAFQDAAHRAAE